MSAAIQSGSFPEGIRRLQTLLTSVGQLPDGDDLAPYIRFRLLTAEYNRDIVQKDADYAKINTKYQDDLNQFVSAHAITVDKDGNVWAADFQAKDGKGMQVIKFSPDGKVLLKLGKAGESGMGASSLTSISAVTVYSNLSHDSLQIWPVSLIGTWIIPIGASSPIKTS